MPAKTNWSKALKPLFKKYQDKAHPLEYKNLYQLLVMVVLSAQTNDIIINQIAPELFKAFPDFQSLSNVSADALYPYISKVRGFGKKAEWLIKIADKLKSEKHIPINMDELTFLPGIGRKSANVIRAEAGQKPEGVVVDLHVIRIAPRLGIANGKDAKRIEKQLMKVLPQKDWNAGMYLSYLGRETCRPTNPKHNECVLRLSCKYYLSLQSKKRTII